MYYKTIGTQTVSDWFGRNESAVVEQSGALRLHIKRGGKMKKIIFVVLALVVFLSSCVHSTHETYVQSTHEEKQPFSIHKEIIPGLFFERESMTDNSIFFAKEATSQSRKYVVENKMIFRYAVENDYIVYHWNELVEGVLPNTTVRTVYQSDYSIIDDRITVYDYIKDEYQNFANQMEFKAFCETQNINFNWFYPSGFEPIITKAESFEIHDFESESVCDYIVKDNVIIYEGYISDVNIKNDQVSFKLQIPHKSTWEFQDSENNSLNISFEQNVGRKQVGLFLYEDVYFNDYLTINIGDSMEEQSGDGKEK